MGAARILPLPLMELPNFPLPLTNRSISSSSSSSSFNIPHYITPPPPLRHLPPLHGTTLRPSFLLSDHRKRQSFATPAAAASDASDEWGPEPPSPLETVVVDGGQENGGEAAKLKKALVESFYGTDRGLKASSETRAEIVELITQLEALNPTPAPTEALSLLNGKWILAYTTFSELFPLLATGTLPLVKVEEVSQTIDSSNFTVENSVQLVGPLATTSLTTNAKFEIRSPKRVQIKFEQGIIGTPQLTDSIVIPENLNFLGQKIDLAPLKGLLTSVQGAASSVAKRISDQPPVKFPITSEKAQSWLLTTYLDNEFRISRGDGSSVFVLIKEGCPLLK